MTALLVAGIVLLAIGGCCLAYGVCGLLDSHREGGRLGVTHPSGLTEAEIQAYRDAGAARGEHPAVSDTPTYCLDCIIAGTAESADQPHEAAICPKDGVTRLAWTPCANPAVSNSVHEYAHTAPRGSFPQLKGVWAKRNLQWRRWAARMFGAAICGGFTRRWE